MDLHPLCLYKNNQPDSYLIYSHESNSFSSEIHEKIQFFANFILSEDLVFDVGTKPMLLEGWELLCSIGFSERDLDLNLDGTTHQPLFVSKKPGCNKVIDATSQKKV